MWTYFIYGIAKYLTIVNTVNNLQSKRLIRLAIYLLLIRAHLMAE